MTALLLYAPWAAVTNAAPKHLQLMQPSNANKQRHIQCPWGKPDADSSSWRPVLLPQPGRPRTELLSFPGSGNSWVRHLIETLTGYRTNSIYHCNKKVTNELAAVTSWRASRNTCDARRPIQLWGAALTMYVLLAELPA